MKDVAGMKGTQPASASLSQIDSIGGLLRLIRAADAERIPKECIVGASEGGLGKSVMVRNRKRLSETIPDIDIYDASLEDIVVYHMRGREK